MEILLFAKACEIKAWKEHIKETLITSGPKEARSVINQGKFLLSQGIHPSARTMALRKPKAAEDRPASDGDGGAASGGHVDLTTGGVSLEFSDGEIRKFVTNGTDARLSFGNIRNLNKLISPLAEVVFSSREGSCSGQERVNVLTVFGTKTGAELALRWLVEWCGRFSENPSAAITKMESLSRLLDLGIEDLRADSKHSTLEMGGPVMDRKILNFLQLGQFSSFNCSGSDWKFVGGLELIALGKATLSRHAEERQEERAIKDRLTRVLSTIANGKMLATTAGEFPPVWALGNYNGESRVYVVTATDKFVLSSTFLRIITCMAHEREGARDMTFKTYNETVRQTSKAVKSQHDLEAAKLAEKEKKKKQRANKGKETAQRPKKSGGGGGGGPGGGGRGNKKR